MLDIVPIASNVDMPWGMATTGRDSVRVPTPPSLLSPMPSMSCPTTHPGPGAIIPRGRSYLEAEHAIARMDVPGADGARRFVPAHGARDCGAAPDSFDSSDSPSASSPSRGHVMVCTYYIGSIITYYFIK